MSFRTEADEKHDQLEEHLILLRSQCKNCGSIISEMMAQDTAGSDQWSNVFTTKTHFLRKMLLDLDYHINEFLNN